MPRSPLLALVVLAGAALVAAHDDCFVQTIDYVTGVNRVRFLGKSPNFQIFPNTSLDGYLQLRFFKLQELTAANQAVTNHSVTSFAAAAPTWTAANTSVNGVSFTLVRLTLDPTTFNGFDTACPSTSGRRALHESEEAAGAGRALLQTTVTPTPLVTLSLYFGNANSATFPYGNNKTETIPAGSVKVTVEYSNWPFCNVNNTLSLEIDLLLKGDAAAKPIASSSTDGTKYLTISLGNGTVCGIRHTTYAYEGISGVRSLPVGVSINNTNTTSTMVLKLPNPAPNSSVYYDLTVVSNIILIVPGSAAGVRVTLWTLAAAVLLSVFMS
ncbi:hypothetical protein TSOC_007340 [Tetrabaena socialis]|uniref:Pherophorin domain-containing protein n=1 Tax=Tetrabaena socialis TaxID=47790 RepID=A0A2J8A1G4_9CHLO|nr:hypothetical protein TSOC_007340 [Tetrabaena socialis]|eukprot:PNH06338.1 hypothetical protein TSOC_007340 [Tetrabaena socialis]